MTRDDGLERACVGCARLADDHDLRAAAVPEDEVRHHERHDAHGAADLRAVALERPAGALAERGVRRDVAERDADCGP